MDWGWIRTKARSYWCVDAKLLIGAHFAKVVPKMKNLGFVLNERLTAVDHSRKKFQRIYRIPMEVRRRLVLSLILPHIKYGNIVFTNAVSASQKGLGGLHSRLVCILYIWRNGLIMFHTWSRLYRVLCWRIMPGLSICHFYTRYCMLAILLICFLCFILPH
jgi:hypothetical protein